LKVMNPTSTCYYPSMRIAHLSDLHLFPEGALWTSGMFNRRLLGAFNLVLVRNGVHSIDVARAAVREVVEQKVDHTVITGDLTNLALESEFRLASEVLAPLGGYERLTIVPGNHDYYAPVAVHAGAFERWFGPTLWGKDGKSGEWPVVKDQGDIVLVAVRTAMIPPVTRAWGLVGKDQLLKIRRVIDEARGQGKDTLVFMHHNLHHRGFVQEKLGRLVDKSEAAEMLADAGATLVLHGHDHREHEMVLTGERGEGAGTLVVGCGSTTTGLSGRGRPGRFNIYTIEDGNVGIERWRYLASQKRFLPLAE